MTGVHRLRGPLQGLTLAALVAFGATPATAQSFGAAVQFHEGELLVGENGTEAGPGLVYRYGQTDDGWVLLGEIESPESAAGDQFGTSVVVHDRWLAVGATDIDEDRGTVFLFERVDGEWQPVGRTPTGGIEPGARIGASITFDDSVIVTTETGSRGRSGAAHVFRRTRSGWVHESILESEDGGPGDRFGTAITLHDGQVLIGAPGQAAGDVRGAGAIHVFERADDGSWSRATTLTAPDQSQGAGFGSTLAVDRTADGLVLYVGTPGFAGRSGTVYAFSPNETGDWTLSSRLFPFAADGSPGFGSSIEISGTGTLLIGAPGLGSGSGGVYEYRKEGPGWSVGLIDWESQEPRDRFGARLSAGEGIVASVMSGRDYGAGAVVLLQPSADGWSPVAELVGGVRGFEPITGGAVDCEEGAAALFECAEVDVLSFLPVAALGGNRGVRVNDIWGWTDPETGREYALVGMTDQASFVDITDAENPRYVGRLLKPDEAFGSTWRDIKVYEDHAFIVSDGAGQHGMQVFDLKQLREVGAEPVDFSATAHYPGIASAHNIVVNEETGFAYSVGTRGGGETCGGGLHMIDIRNPGAPTFAGCFSHENTGRRGTGYSHDALCLVYEGPDAEHEGKEICFGSNETHLSIADVSDKGQPVALGVADYPNVGYAHQGWVTADQRYFFMNDELDELTQGASFAGTRTLIWDISDLDDPVLVKEHFGETLTSDHNLYVNGRYMYQSNYVSGLRILDVADPENPVEVAYFDTVPYSEAPGFNGSWSNYPFFQSGTIVVTSGREGLFMLRHRTPELVP